LRARFSPGVGNSVVTFDQSHSSSSATSCARPVIVPCPISERATRTTTVSSGRITTQALISGEPSWARTTSGPNGRRRPSARPPAAAALLTIKERRLNFGMAVMVFSSRLGCCVDRFAHLLEGAAAADIGDGGVDIGVGRPRLVPQQRRNRHDHAGLAVAALRHFVVDPGLLHLVQDIARGQPLDRRDPLARGRAGRHRARTHGGAVDVNRAGATLGNAAAVFRPGQPDLLAYGPQQRRAGLDVHLVVSSVDVELYDFPSSWLNARARPRRHCAQLLTAFPGILPAVGVIAAALLMKTPRKRDYSGVYTRSRRCGRLMNLN